MSAVTLTNQTNDPVIWESGEQCDFTINSEIDIWQISVSESLPYIDNHISILEPGEILRANKYLREQDRNRFLISRGSLRRILSKYLKQPAGDIRFKLSESKKPFIEDLTSMQLHFNLTDSVDRVLIAIANSPVGIDVELIKPGFRYHDILTNNFSTEEAVFIAQQNSDERFFLLWTRKEAILKATGIGLTDQLKQIPSLDGRHSMDGSLLSTQANWQLSSFKAAENYIATIACDKHDANVRYWDFAF